MKIGVEASALARKQRTGVDHYAFNLVKALAELRPRDEFVLPYLYFFTKPDTDMGFRLENVAQKRVGFIPGKVYNVLFRYLWAPPIDLLGRAKADIYVFPNFVRWPLLFTRKSLVIIYDLSYIHSAENSAARHKSFLTKFVPRAIARSKAVITISENSKREIMTQYDVKSKDIVVAPPAVDTAFFKPIAKDQCSGVLEEQGLKYGRYILFIGTIEPRKNINGLLDACALLDPKIRELFPLVLVGGKGWLDDVIHSKIAAMRDRGLSIIQVGYLPYADLPKFYSGASVFVFPSLYEGFGMPPLEAMACGTPVVVANNSSLPEVVGEAGLLVNATSPQAIAAAIDQVIGDKALAKRLVASGFEQVKKFSWKTSAQTVSDLIDRCAK